MMRLQTLIYELTSSTLRSYYDGVANAITNKRVSLWFDRFENQAYSRSVGNISYEIVIGCDFYPLIRGFDKEMPIETMDTRKYTKDILMVIDAVFWHEIFHLMYTDMGFASLAMHRFKQSELYGLFMYFKKMFNIIEDKYIETEGTFQHSFTYQPIRYLNYVAELSQNKQEASSHQWDETNPDDLITFLYYMLRVPNLSVQEHPVYTKHKQFIDNAISLVLQTFIPTLRVERTIALTIELMKSFEIDYDPEMDEVEFPSFDMDSLVDKQKDNELSKNYNPSQLQPKNFHVKDLEHMTNNSSIVRTGDQFLDRNQTLEDVYSLSTQTEKPTKITTMIEPTSDLFIDMMVKKLANNSPYNLQQNITLDSNQVLNSTGKEYLEQYLDVVFDLQSKYSKEIAIVASIFDELKENARAKKRDDLYTGDKLNLTSLYNPSMIGKYQSDITDAEINDLSVQLLVDMSGSMSNAKSTYARDAAFLIASALQYSDVPFELSYFATDMSGNSMNGIVKTFDEPLTTIAKQKIAMMDMRQSRKLGHTYFEVSGTSNIDESAIFSATNRFQERHEKTKLLIVLSDGATCGSESLLKLVVDSLPDYGIDVFAVGLYSDVVAKIYTDHILIDNTEDLQKLPKTLMDVVLRNVSTVL
jgi:hypothetical protein